MLRFSYQNFFKIVSTFCYSISGMKSYQSTTNSNVMPSMSSRRFAASIYTRNWLISRNWSVTTTSDQNRFRAPSISGRLSSSDRHGILTLIKLSDTILLLFCCPVNSGSSIRRIRQSGLGFCELGFIMLFILVLTVYLGIFGNVICYNVFNIYFISFNAIHKFCETSYPVCFQFCSAKLNIANKIFF